MARKRRRQRSLADFVLDGSVALAWYFQDEADAYADAVGGAFPSVRAIVPAIWHLEIANAILMGERRRRSTEAQANAWLGYVATLPIALDDETVARAWGHVLPLGRVHRLTAYDAAYLELAMRRGLPIATLDEPLRTAAAAVGVTLFQP